MNTIKTSRLRQIVGRVKKSFAELDYAQRRLWEIRTETSGLGPQQPRKRKGSAKSRQSLTGAASS